MIEAVQNIISRGLKVLVAAFLLLQATIPAVAFADGDKPDNKKVFVCKYVGTPGVNEHLQTGNNPINVSINAIPNYQGVGSYFADQHGRSYVLAEDIGQEEPNVDECPMADSEDGKIIIAKNAIEDSSQAFSFTTNGLSTDNTGFQLTDDNTPGVPEKTFTNLGAGTYTIAELPAEGWYLDKIVCSEGSTVQKNLATGTVVITLDKDEVVRCTFKNREKEQLPPDYCDYVQVLRDTTSGNALTRLRSLQFTGEDCFKVEVIQKCGSLNIVVTDTVRKGDTDWLYAAYHDQLALDPDGEFPINFPEDYNGGNVLVNWSVLGTENDYVAGWNSKGTATIKTDCKQEAKLTLKKVVVNNSGGKAKAKDWTLKAKDAQGQTALSGNTVASGTVPAGTYSLSESDGPSGYKASDWVCVDAQQNPVSVVEGSVSLLDNQKVTCTITNNDIPPTITVTKSVSNKWGGTLDATSFPLFVNLTPVTSGQALSVNTGTHLVWEWQQPGYELKGVSGDCKYFLGFIYVKASSLDANYTCNILNEDKPASITVKKIVKNRHGGTLEASDFNNKLNVNHTGLDHWETIKLPTGTHKIWEDYTPGYKLTDISCYSGFRKISKFNGWKATVDLSLDEHVICYLTNEDVAPEVTVKKIAFGDKSTEFDFDLDQNSYKYDQLFDLSNFESQTYQLKAGEVEVTEQSSDGWDLTDRYCKVWSHWGWKHEVHQEIENGASFNAEIGKKYLCVFINDQRGNIGGTKYDNFENTLPGWQFTLEKKVCEKPDVIDSFNDTSLQQNVLWEKECEWQWQTVGTSEPTSEDGTYNFSGLEYGLYRVCEVPQLDWDQVYPSTEDSEGCHTVFLNRFKRNRNDLNFVNKQRTALLGLAPVCREGFPYVTLSITLNYLPVGSDEFEVSWLTSAGVPAGGTGSYLNITVSEFDMNDNGDGTYTFSKTLPWLGSNSLIPDWPGFELVDGEWVEDPSDLGGNTRPSAKLKVSINPEATTDVNYPDASTGCNDPENGHVLGTDTLANTGFPATITMLLAFVTIASAWVVVRKEE